MRLLSILAALLALVVFARAQGTRIKDLPLASSIGTNGRIAIDDATIGLRGASVLQFSTAIAPYVQTNYVLKASGSATDLTVTNSLFSGRMELFGDGLTIDGNETNDVSGNIRTFLITDLALVESQNVDQVYFGANNSLTVQGGDLTLWGNSNVYFLTPNALTFSAPSNAVLTIKDPTLGKVEFTPIEQLIASTLTAGKATYLNSQKQLTTSATTSTELAYVSGVTYSLATSSRLVEIASGELYEMTSATVDSDGCVTTGTVKWPDGSAGTFTRTAKDSTWLVVNAYTITHSNSGKTVTQSTVTRDSSTGAVTTKPALTVSP